MSSKSQAVLGAIGEVFGLRQALDMLFQVRGRAAQGGRCLKLVTFFPHLVLRSPLPSTVRGKGGGGIHLDCVDQSKQTNAPAWKAGIEGS